MGKTFFVSDLHFGHKNIILYEDRPFRSLDEMTNELIANWNSVVSDDDTVYIAGDVSFYSLEETQKIVARMRGRKTLILGNHDKAHSRGWWLKAGFDQVISTPIIFQDWYIVSHEPVYLSAAMPYVNIHGHLHSKKMSTATVENPVNQYFNVSVEKINYTPIDFEDIKAYFGNGQPKAELN